MPELTEPTEPTDERLAAILASVADHLVVTPGTGDDVITDAFEPNGWEAPAAEPDAARRRKQRGHGQRKRRPDAPGHGRWRQRVLVAAAVVLVATLASLTVAPVREAVAGWLGIGSTEIERVPDGEGDPRDLPYLGDELEPIDEATAESRLGEALPATGETALGPAPVLAAPREGGVIMAWADGATTLWVQQNDRPAHEVMDKLLTIDDRLVPVDDLGEEAAVIEGPHVLVTPLRRLAAGTVVIWVDDGLEYRLESDLGVDDLVAIARSVHQR